MTTTNPALVPPQIDHLCLLTSKQKTILARMVAEFGEENRMNLVGYLQGFGWDEETVEYKIKALQKYVDLYETSELDIIPFIGMDVVHNVPKACAVLLEDGRGGCARDFAGNPITVTFGMPPQVDPDRAIRVTLFTVDRLRDLKYFGAKQVPNFTSVVDLAIRKDLDSFNYVLNPKMMEFMSNFPSTGKLYVCGASPTFVSGIKRFVGATPFASFLDNVVFDTGYSCLDGVIPYEHMLPWWHEKASFDFDIDKYKLYLLDGMKNLY